MTTRMKQVREVLDSRQHHETATEVPVLVERAITETTAMYPDAAIETALDGVDSVTLQRFSARPSLNVSKTPSK
ncbi:hypothetical protein C9J85_18910 [Haloferax sp. wsp5]|nr:hypothetical protein C9J85_18910 [Haloferax sp. wsp5]